LHGLLEVLLESCKGAVRLAFERRSAAAETDASSWMERIVDFDLLGIEGGSTRLVLEAPSLEAVVPDLPVGAEFVRAIGVETTAFDLFLAGLRDATRAEGDSERFDVPLLETYGRLGQLLMLGFEEIEIGGDPPCRLNAAAFDVLAMLKLRTPLSRQVRVAGRLETVPHAEHAFTLRLPEGVVYGLVSGNVTPDQLARLAGTQVVVSGLAVFRASGRVLRIEAHHVEAADERASVWRHMPRPLFEAAEPVASYRLRQGPQSGLAAIMGKWPGDETDEEIAAILEHLS
jgi:hypothetical protein